MNLSHAAILGLACCLAASPAAAAEPYSIRVIDDVTGRGVPLVELTTVNNIRYVTDSAGRIAMADAGLMDQQVYFHIKSHGYEYPADQFGYRGKALDVVPGGTVEIRIRRINIAERLYRVTGGDIYLDSVLLDEPVPLEKPLINAGVRDDVPNSVEGVRVGLGVS